MKITGKKRYLVTLSFFSPVGIVFSSLQGLTSVFVILGCAFAFTAMFGAVELSINMAGINLLSVCLFVVGVMGLSTILYYRSRAFEISILDPSRTILGVPGYSYPLSFSDVDRLAITDSKSGWQILMHLKKRDIVPLAIGVPLSFARKVSIHASKLLEVPVITDDGRKLNWTDDEIDWIAPKNIPSSKFPLEYIFLSAVLAATIALIIGFNLSSIFHSELAPKWMLLLSIAFPGGQLITNIQEYRGFKPAVAMMCCLLTAIYLATILSQVEPATTFLGLIPTTVLILLFINAYVERRKLFPWILATSLVVIGGLWLTLVSSYNYHAFFRLDPAVILSIDVSSHGSTDLILTSPNETRTVVRALKFGRLQRNVYKPVSRPVVLLLKRPVGRNYKIILYREGSGNKHQATCHLYCKFAGFDLPLGKLAAEEMDKALCLLSSLHGIWPPEY